MFHTLCQTLACYSRLERRVLDFLCARSGTWMAGILQSYSLGRESVLA